MKIWMLILSIFLAACAAGQQVIDAGADEAEVPECTLEYLQKTDPQAVAKAQQESSARSSAEIDELERVRDFFRSTLNTLAVISPPPVKLNRLPDISFRVNVKKYPVKAALAGDESPKCVAFVDDVNATVVRVHSLERELTWQRLALMWLNRSHELSKARTESKDAKVLEDFLPKTTALALEFPLNPNSTLGLLLVNENTLVRALHEIMQDEVQLLYLMDWITRWLPPIVKERDAGDSFRKMLDVLWNASAANHDSISSFADVKDQPLRNAFLAMRRGGKDDTKEDVNSATNAARVALRASLVVLSHALEAGARVVLGRMTQVLTEITTFEKGKMETAVIHQTRLGDLLTQYEPVQQAPQAAKASTPQSTAQAQATTCEQKATLLALQAHKIVAPPTGTTSQEWETKATALQAKMRSQGCPQAQ